MCQHHISSMCMRGPSLLCAWPAHAWPMGLTERGTTSIDERPQVLIPKACKTRGAHRAGQGHFRTHHGQPVH